MKGNFNFLTSLKALGYVKQLLPFVCFVMSGGKKTNVCQKKNLCTLLIAEF